MNGTFLEGHSTVLRSLQATDFGEPMVRWVNDRVVTRFLFRGTFPGNADEFAEEYRRLAGSRSDIQLAVLERASGRYIGIAGLHCINWIARNAEFRVLIGERDCWGKGYGTEVLQLMTAYGFEILNLRKVWLGVNSGNRRAAESYKKAGYIVEGELRDEIYRNGTYFNAIRMSLLRSEYEEQKSQWKIADLIQTQFSKQP